MSVLNDLMLGLAGGLLIGLAAALLMWLNGRIMGLSGIAAGLLQGGPEGRWRLAFVAGTLAGGILLALAWPTRLAPMPDMPAWQAGLAGLLVGFGARLGSGCTSGHGVCGLSRLSPRSLAATFTFMATGMLTVWLTRHVLGG